MGAEVRGLQQPLAPGRARHGRRRQLRLQDLARRPALPASPRACRPAASSAPRPLTALRRAARGPRAANANGGFAPTTAPTRVTKPRRPHPARARHERPRHQGAPGLPASRGLQGRRSTASSRQATGAAVAVRARQDRSVDGSSTRATSTRCGPRSAATRSRRRRRPSRDRPPRSSPPATRRQLGRRRPRHRARRRSARGQGDHRRGQQDRQAPVQVRRRSRALGATRATTAPGRSPTRSTAPVCSRARWPRTTTSAGARPGPGQWVTIYTNSGHIYMIVAGLRFDTSGRGPRGSRWQQDMRDPGAFTIRHPAGL